MVDVCLTFLSHPTFQDFPQHTDPLLYVVWISSCPAGKQQGVRSDPRRTKPSSKSSSTFHTRGAGLSPQNPKRGTCAVHTCSKNQSLQQTIAEHEDCPRGPLGPRALAGPGDQATAGRSGHAGLRASASRWPQVGWGLCAAPKGLGARDRPQRRKPGQVPVTALCAKGNCFSSWGRAGQGSSAGQQVCDRQAPQA